MPSLQESKRLVVLASNTVLFKQFVDADLGCASYLIGDERAGVAVVVDPAFAIEQYLDEARREGVRLTAVIETHTHADHLSGHGRLALEQGLPVHIHPIAEVAYPHEALADGQELEVGSVKVKVLHTPGHRPEHCSLLVDERLLLSGDSLFVGDAARPDLAVEAREGARDLFHSLHRLAELPDAVSVYPGHVAGSLCGGQMSADPSSTIGAERSGNHALAIPDVEGFVNASASISAPRPPNLHRIVALNTRPFVGAAAPLAATSVDGATVLDVRPARTYAAGHIPGALNVPISGSSFGTRSAFLLSPEERIVLHGSADEVEHAARGLRAVGFLELGGYLDHPETPETMATVEIGELDALLANGEVEVIDVREKDERDAGYIAGSRHIPYRLLRSLADELPADRPLVTICESGPRAAIAASVLAAAGLDAHPVVGGGIETWAARGGRTIEFRRCGS
jgi:glyoxylase-like metal-dependent hydrolase (beta-lactamase superfamily II)/rhodanese-related sulfurtransferase